MDPAELNRDWALWLEGRLTDERQAAQLREALQADPRLRTALASDLDVHRQLIALAATGGAADRFVQQMMSLFDQQPATGTAESPAPPRRGSMAWLENATARPIAPTTGDFAHRHANHAAGASKESTGNSISIEPAINDRRSRRHASKKKYRQGNRMARRQWVAAMSVATLLVTAIACLIVVMLHGIPATESPAGSPKQIAGPDPQRTTPLPRENEVVPPAPRGLAKTEPAAPDGAEPEIRSPDAMPKLAHPAIAQVDEQIECRWGTNRPADSQVAAGPLELLSGKAVLRFDDGDQLELSGPALLDIRSPELVEVQQGNVRVTLAGSGTPLVVQSGAGRIDPQPLARYDLSVEPTGHAQVNVESGALEVRPWHGRVQDNVIALDKQGFDRLTVETASEESPAVARLQGDGGQFEGWINFDGEVLRSRDPQLTTELFDRARGRFAEDPLALRREWQNLVRSLQESARAQVPGNGAENRSRPLAPPDIDSFIRQMSEMMAPGMAAPGNAVNSAFEGVLVIDGREQRFDNRADYEAARRELFGSFADLFDQSRQ